VQYPVDGRRVVEGQFAQHSFMQHNPALDENLGEVCVACEVLGGPAKSQ
jgi:hypothetical protein